MEQGVAEQGQGLVEYALTAVLVVAAVAAALSVLGVNILGVFQAVVTQMPPPG